MQCSLNICTKSSFYNYRCQSNCNNYVDPSRRLALTGVCQNCGPNAVYQWFPDPSLSHPNLTDIFATNLTSRNLVVKPNSLNASLEYVFSLMVTKKSGTLFTVCLSDSLYTAYNSIWITTTIILMANTIRS